MYIFKNALRCIGRARGRNILIGVIVFVIGLSACIGLSIRQAAQSARTEALSNMKISASISYDRRTMMGNMGGKGENGSFDKDSFSKEMSDRELLTAEDYQKFAEAEAVEDFYYTITTSLDGVEEFSSVTTETEEDTTEKNDEQSSNRKRPNNMGGFGKGGIGGGMQGELTLIGYSNEKAMTDFTEGLATITEGTVFTEGDAAYNCIIPAELAEFNSVSVGDTITLCNPNNEEEAYTLTITGIFESTATNETGNGFMGMTANDPVNQIHLSYNALSKLISASADYNSDDEGSGAALNGSLSATYLFANVDDYEAFEEQARALGLEDTYSISSQDVEDFEKSLVPLDTLSRLAGYFLAIILVIGAVILIVFNIFNVRERKYEIGVLTAMGMKKCKVALQFVIETLVVTLLAVIIGAGVGAVASVPVTNTLLEGQVESQQSSNQRVEQGFGRGGKDTSDSDRAADITDTVGGGFDPFGAIMGQNNQNAYVTEIRSAVNLTVILQMLGIGILLTIFSGAASMLFIMRYEPLKILANRD